MEWTYHITKSFTIDRRSLYKDMPADPTIPLTTSQLYTGMNDAQLSFSPGEIDEILFCSLKKGYPDCVMRRPKNDLVAAVYAARGLT